MNQTVEIFPSEREKIYERFADRLETSYNLSRKVVSFQANKIFYQKILEKGIPYVQTYR